MKKILYVTSALVSISSITLAETKGSYITTSATINNLDYTTNVIGGNTDDTSVGVNLSYGYAFPLQNEWYIAPEISYDMIDSTASDMANDTVDVGSKYGFMANLGYDVSDVWSVYGLVGVEVLDYDIDWKSVNQTDSGTETATTIGIGAKYALSETWNANISLSNTSATIDTSLTTSGPNATYEVDINAFKAGFSYKF